MNATATAEHVLYLALHERQVALERRIERTRSAMFEADLDDAAAVMELERSIAFDRASLLAVQDILAKHASGDTMGNYMREWLKARGELEIYGPFNGVSGNVKELPLAMRVEFEIDMLRTRRLNTSNLVVGKDNDQLRRGNILGALHAHLSRKAIEAAAVELEQMLAA
jgi:hypothetical protein